MSKTLKCVFPPCSSPLELPVLAVSHWVPDAPSPRLLTVWMNRVQNHAVIELIGVGGAGPSGQPGVSRIRLAELQKEDGWIDLFEEGTTGQGAAAHGRVLLPLSKAVGKDSFRSVGGKV